MPRRLSDQEWTAFQQTINVNALNLPPWGAVVQWGDALVLVYVCPSSGGLCQKGEVMLSDVTDRRELFQSIPGTYDAAQSVWWYQITPQLMQRTAEMARATLEGTGTILKAAAETVGEAAGGLTAPLLSNLAPVLIAALVLFLFMESKR